MRWLNEVVDKVLSSHPEGEILIESGSSPSGSYHLGHLREFVICDAILLELRRRGRSARHFAYVDDLDALRKIPVNVPQSFNQYLGRSLCDIPAPDGSSDSYADYFLQGIIEASRALGIEVKFVRTHEKYRSGFFVPAIEKALYSAEKIRKILENVSGHKLEDTWSPIQINEEGYLKKRKFLGIDTTSKTITYEDVNGNKQSTGYAKGEVKLDWRIDWPARWWLLKVDVEPFGRDHATKGGSYDTGAALSTDVFKSDPPIAVPYDFVNLAGDTKKMSASQGTGLEARESIRALPPEIFRFFMLRFPPKKRLYFDPVNVSKLIDDYAQLLAKKDKNVEEKQLIQICQAGFEATVSSIPFSHLVASYQAALKDPDKTLDVMSRTEHKSAIEAEREIIKKELDFIDNWLQRWASEEVKFELLDKVDPAKFSQEEKDLLTALSKKIAQAPSVADGEWFHKAVYDIQSASKMEPKAVFSALYRALIGQEHGPRAGWFLSILPRDWLIKRLMLED